VIFRGQAHKRDLVPSIARKDRTKDSTSHEREMLEQLKLLGASFSELSQPTALDFLVVAQHFGMRTRLLDWTSNPLAALWFACADPTAGDAYVYALVSDDLQERDVYSTDPFETALTRVFQPRLNNQRIVAQHGWFTLHRYSRKSKKFVPIDTNPDTAKHLTEILVPATAKSAMLDALDKFGVNGRTLFPDLQGLCAYLNWRRGSA